MKIINGKYRIVLFAFGLAFKFPKLSFSSEVMLKGMLSNITERNVWKRKSLSTVFNHSPHSIQSYLNPTVFCLPFGLMSIQPEILTINDKISFSKTGLEEAVNFVVSANPKLVQNSLDSFGYDNGCLKIVDYGGEW